MLGMVNREKRKGGKARAARKIVAGIDVVAGEFEEKSCKNSGCCPRYALEAVEAAKDSAVQAPEDVRMR
jgi:hypothetical protein